MTNAVSGMAASIRAATDNETFDLAGHDASNINQTISDAFSQPFHLDRMIRVTFVTGAGKLARQKYDDKAMQTLTSALRKLDYVEDRGASCVNECGGCYKTQHDTGKNLFTVVVFPKLVQEGEDGGAGGASSSTPAEEYPMYFPLAEGTPEHIILVASEEVFAKNALGMCPSWSEKKMCTEVLKAAVETVEKMDAKLMSGTPLSDDENAFYDAVGGATSITTKSDCLKKLMQQQVEKGSLTRHEIDRLLAQVCEKIDSFDEDIDAALQKSQEKKASKLNTQKEKAEARKKMLEGHAAVLPHKLKHEPQILKLKKMLKPLLKLEASSKGRLLSVKETKQLTEMEEMQEQIEELEEASRGWFEDDENFRIRLEASRKRISTAVGGSAGKGSSSAGKKKAAPRSSASGAPTWVTPGGLASRQAARGKKATKKNSRSNGGSAFSAMMMDSDSDSD